MTGITKEKKEKNQQIIPIFQPEYLRFSILGGTGRFLGPLRRPIKRRLKQTEELDIRLLLEFLCGGLHVCKAAASLIAVLSNEKVYYPLLWL